MNTASSSHEEGAAMGMKKDEDDGDGDMKKTGMKKAEMEMKTRLLHLTRVASRAFRGGPAP